MRSHQHLIQRMTEDLRLRGLSPNTVDAYIRSARIFLEFCGCPTDQLDVSDVRRFLLFLIHEKKRSPATVKHLQRGGPVSFCSHLESYLQSLANSTPENAKDPPASVEPPRDRVSSGALSQPKAQGVVCFDLRFRAAGERSGRHQNGAHRLPYHAGVRPRRQGSQGSVHRAFPHRCATFAGVLESVSSGPSGKLAVPGHVFADSHHLSGHIPCLLRCAEASANLQRGFHPLFAPFVCDPFVGGWSVPAANQRTARTCQHPLHDSVFALGECRLWDT